MAEERIKSFQDEVNKYVVKGFNTEELDCCVFFSSKEWYEVNLLNGTCSCEVWQLLGIPYVHVVCCINPLRLHYKDFCHPFVSVEAFKRCYMGYVRPIKCEKDWDKAINQEGLG